METSKHTACETIVVKTGLFQGPPCLRKCAPARGVQCSGYLCHNVLNISLNKSLRILLAVHTAWSDLVRARVQSDL